MVRVGSSPTSATTGQMAELVDAPDSKSGVRKDVWVRFPLWLQNNESIKIMEVWILYVAIVEKSSTDLQWS